MASDFEIGRVVAVDTAQVTIELNPDLKALLRTTYEGAQEVGRINSYVVMPVGARRLVGMITKVVLTEAAELTHDRTMVSLPIAKRLMRATLIGTIDGDRYSQGVTLFPILDNPVFLLTAADLQAIFDQRTAAPPNPERPGYCLDIGHSAVFQDFAVRVDPDAMFGKHLAVLGSTGSGKSCSIASILQAVLAQPEVKRSHIVILDVNGEYRSAFSGAAGVGSAGYLYIPSDAREKKDRISIPYWFMNADDFTRLFRASQGVQRPVLLEALRLAKNSASPRGPLVMLREEVILEINRILSLARQESKTSKDIRALANGAANRLSGADLKSAWADLTKTGSSLTEAKVVGAFASVRAVADKYVEGGTYPAMIPANARKEVTDILEPIYYELIALRIPGAAAQISADSPTYFDKFRFRNEHIEQVLRRDESGGARARDFSGTMLLRIDRLLEDQRYDFLFGPTSAQIPRPKHVLAAFLRDVLGFGAVPNAASALSDQTSVPLGVLPFYDRQRAQEPTRRVVILDLSLLTAEVLENVTALVGRLVLEFLQRLGEYGGEEARGSVPIVLVLEEAQNYIREQRSADDESVSRSVFERVAREGRKFGLGLVVASQRPSELSKTVLSQCSSFVVHRLQNPEDLRYFREIVPGSYAPLLEQLPALAPRTALVLGECVRAPVLVRIREAVPLPRSRDPRFYSYWVRDTAPAVDVEGICARWEGVEPGAPKAVASPTAGSQTGAKPAKAEAAAKGVKPKR